MNNPWDKYVTSWSKEPGGMVQASTERWKGTHFAEDWLRALSGVALEVGPGGGRQTSILMECCGAVDVIDVSQVILDVVVAALPIRKAYLAEMYKEPPEEVPCGYDAFVANYVFCHSRIIDVWRYLKFAAKHVRKGGMVLFDVKQVDRDTWEDFFQYHLEPVDRIGSGVFNIKPISDEVVHCMCNSAGLQVVERRVYPLGNVAYKTQVM